MTFFKRLKIRPALIGYTILACGTGYAIHGLASTGELRDALENSCQRVQVLRAQSNISDSVSFNILALAARREFELAKVTQRTHRIHLDSALRFSRQASKLTVTPLTKCGPAVADGKHYKYPLAQTMGNPYDGTLTPAAKEVLAQSQRFLKLTAKKNSG